MKYQDITRDIGQLFSKTPAKYPMYSFDQAAYYFWQGVYEGMIDEGKTHDEAIKILQSKATRWLLDGKAGNDLMKFGRSLGRATLGCYQDTERGTQDE